MQAAGETRQIGPHGAALRRGVFGVATAVLLLSVEAAGQAQGPNAAIVSELRDHRPANALQDATKALRARPQDAQLWMLKGIAANQLDQPKVALDAFEAALRLAPNSLPALEGAAEVAFRVDRPAARTFVARVLERVPENPQANGMAAMLDVELGDWAAAVDHFSKAAPAIAGQKGALGAQLTALDHLKQEAQAEAVAQHMLELWPDDASVRYNLAVVQMHEKHTHDAVGTLQPLLARKDAAAMALAAAAYEADGETPKAVELLRGAIEQDPKNPQYYLDFATLSFDHSSFPVGIAMLNAGLTQLPETAVLYIARGVLYMQSSEVEKAEQDFATANRLDPTQTFGREAQGLTAMQRHNLPEALETVRASLQKSPRDAYLNYLAAEILKEQGAAPHSPEEKEAIGYAQHAVAADPTLLPALDLLSSLEFAAGDYAAAATECRAALKRDPADQEAIFRLVLALRRLGDKDKEIPGLLDGLRQAKAQEHDKQVQMDRYRLTEVTAGP